MGFQTEAKRDEATLAPMDPYAVIPAGQLEKEVPNDGSFRLKPITELEPEVSELSERSRNSYPHFTFRAIFTGVWCEAAKTLLALTYLEKLGYRVVLEASHDFPSHIRYVTVFGNAENREGFREKVKSAIQQSELALR